MRRYDARLKPLDSIDTGINSTPSSIATSADGRYLAIVFQNARFWLYDARESKIAPLRIAGRGDVSAAAFAGDKLFVADRLTRVTEYDLAKGTSARQWEGPQPLIDKIYRYGLHPLYAVFPKPGELNETVSHVLTSDDAKIAGPRLDRGLPRRRRKSTSGDPSGATSCFWAWCWRWLARTSAQGFLRAAVVATGYLAVSSSASPPAPYTLRNASMMAEEWTEMARACTSV